MGLFSGLLIFGGFLVGAWLLLRWWKRQMFGDTLTPRSSWQRDQEWAALVAEMNRLRREHAKKQAQREEA